MSSDTDSLEKRRDLMERTAKQAGSIIQDIRSQARANATQKALGQGPVTEADLAADAFISAEVKTEWPDDLVITEETWKTGTTLETHQHTWFIDPLDGTKDFVRGGDDYSVMIGFAVNQQPTLGVVYQPATGLLWSANKAIERCERVGADGARTTLDVRLGHPVPEQPRIAVSRSHPEVAINNLLSSHKCVPVVKGSVGLKIGLLLDGKADAYVSGSTRTKVWDTCAPQAIINAAGGEMTAIDGSVLRYGETATHGKGLRAWTPAAKTRLEPILNSWLLQFPDGPPFKKK
jgi:3'(2'), 5'-bisphosphate nucleotidase